MNKPLFGPAGNSDSFTKAYKGSVHAPKWLREMGLLRCGILLSGREFTPQQRRHIQRKYPSVEFCDPE